MNPLPSGLMSHYGRIDLGNDLLAAGYYGLGRVNRIVLVPGGELYLPMLIRAFSCWRSTSAGSCHVRFPKRLQTGRSNSPMRRPTQGDPTIMTHQSTREWIHPLSVILGALIDAGLTIVMFSRARGLALARRVDLGACLGQTMAPSRWSSAHSPVHFGKSEKGLRASSMISSGHVG